MFAVVLCAALSLTWRAYLNADHLASVVALVVVNYLVYAAVIARFCLVKDGILQLSSQLTKRWPGFAPARNLLSTDLFRQNSRSITSSEFRIFSNKNIIISLTPSDIYFSTRTLFYQS